MSSRSANKKGAFGGPSHRPSIPKQHYLRKWRGLWLPSAAVTAFRAESRNRRGYSFTRLLRGLGSRR